MLEASKVGSTQAARQAAQRSVPMVWCIPWGAQPTSVCVRVIQGYSMDGQVVPFLSFPSRFESQLQGPVFDAVSQSLFFPTATRQGSEICSKRPGFRFGFGFGFGTGSEISLLGRWRAEKARHLWQAGGMG